jgi:hypothetical protein
MKKMLILKEKDRISVGPMRKEISTPVLRFRLQFLNNDDENQAVHKVEVRNINFLDLMQHLKRGESVFITPILEDSIRIKKQDRTLWYFAHA